MTDKAMDIQNDGEASFTFDENSHKDLHIENIETIEPEKEIEEIKKTWLESIKEKYDFY